MFSRILIKKAFLFGFFAVVSGSVALNAAGEIPQQKKFELKKKQGSMDILLDDHQNVIVYPKGFEAVAKEYADFHKEFEGATSILMSLEDVKKKGRTSKKVPSFPGWQTEKPKLNKITGYEYDVALMLADALKDHGAKKRLDSVMILGNGKLIPPSYYFHYQYERDLPAPEIVKEYTEWLASDLFYGAPDFQMEYKWAVGRVSVRTPEEARNYLKKLIHYKEQTALNPPIRNIYTGCNALQDYQFMGEMAQLYLQDKGLFGNGIKFYNESRGNLTKEKVLKSFAKDNAQFHWMFTHGMGEGFVMEDNQQVKEEDILNVDLKTNLPIVLSPSCLDAGYDYDLIDMPWDKGPDKNISVGEAILLSKGAGIGYMGSTRMALAGADFYTEKTTGRVKMRETTYITDLLTDTLYAYVHKGYWRIGNAFRAGHNRNWGELHNKTDPGYMAMYVNFTYLGDPVISMPKPIPPTRLGYKGIEFLNYHFTGEVDVDVEVPGYTPSGHALSTPPTIMFTSAKGNPKMPIHYYIIDISDLKVVKEGTMPPGSIHKFKTTGEKKTYLLRTWVARDNLQNKDKKTFEHYGGNESSWHYVTIDTKDNATPAQVVLKGAVRNVPDRTLSAKTTETRVDAAPAA